MALPCHTVGTGEGDDEYRGRVILLLVHLLGQEMTCQAGMWHACLSATSLFDFLLCLQFFYGILAVGGEFCLLLLFFLLIRHLLMTYPFLPVDPIYRGL